MKIYVVSLKNHERRLNIISMAKTYNIDVVFFDAVEGKKLNANYIDNINKSKWVKNKYKRSLGPNEIGCSLSHRAIYSKIVEENKSAIILEDDITFDDKLRELASISNIDNDNLYILGGQDGLESNEMIIRSKWFDTVSILNGIKFNRALFSSKYIYRTCCYIVTPTVARNLINFSKNNFYLADDWYNLSSNKLFKKLYITNIISHPAELNSSSIENERIVKKTNWDNSFLRYKLRNIYKNIRCILDGLL